MVDNHNSAEEVSGASNANVVRTLLQALQDEDYSLAESLLAPELIYHNVGLPPLQGPEVPMRMFRWMEGKIGTEIKLVSIVANDFSVHTERVDAMVFGPFRMQFWVCGIFQVQEGKVRLWRDYADVFSIFIKAPVRAILGAIIPAVRPKF